VQSSVQPIFSVQARWLCVATAPRSKMALRSPPRKAVLEQALARAAGDELLRARAGGQCLRGDADDAAACLLAGDRRA